MSSRHCLVLLVAVLTLLNQFTAKTRKVCRDEYKECKKKCQEGDEIVPKKCIKVCRQEKKECLSGGRV